MPAGIGRTIGAMAQPASYRTHRPARPTGQRWRLISMAILVGVVTYVTIEIMTQGAGYGWAAPHLIGLAASAVTYLILAVFN